MKNILTFMMIFTSLLPASDHENDNQESKSRMERQIQKEIEKEKKYAKEQTFYTGEEYDLKAAEINPDSLSSLPDLEDDDFDMDSVYD